MMPGQPLFETVPRRLHGIPQTLHVLIRKGSEVPCHGYVVIDHFLPRHTHYSGGHRQAERISEQRVNVRFPGISSEQELLPGYLHGNYTKVFGARRRQGDGFEASILRCVQCHLHTIQIVVRNRCGQHVAVRVTRSYLINTFNALNG